MGTQFYYPVGLVSVLYAVGCVPTAAWFTSQRVRRAWVTAGVALNAAVSLVLALPVIPLSALGKTPVPGINQTARDTVGWPTYVDQVRAVYDGLPTADKAQAQLVASNYGEAGALDRYGAGLPPVFSGQNGLYRARPPVRVGGDSRRRPGACGTVVVCLLHDCRPPGQRPGCRQRGAGRADRGVPGPDRWLGFALATVQAPGLTVAGLLRAGTSAVS